MMTGVSSVGQLRELLFCGGMGFLLGGYYDVFRVLRCLLRPRAWQVVCQDVLYAVSSAFIVFFFLMALNGGVLRAYVYVGLVVGFLVYRRTVGRAVVRIGMGIAECCRAVENAISRGLSAIGRRIAVVWRKPATFGGRLLRKNLKKFSKKS